jgi:hypothetical protein
VNQGPPVRLVGSSVVLEDVAKMLGHSSTKVTERYAHLLDSPLATIAAETDAWWIASKKANGTGTANAASVQ